MCGILGNFGYVERYDFSGHVKKVSHLLSGRGPEQTNINGIENFSAVHSRLIVQGSLDDGVQPMRYENIEILFNGNLYNKDSLKVGLELMGYKFNGVSDTEVVAVSIYHWGNKAFEKFNGFFLLFAFILIIKDNIGT